MYATRGLCLIGIALGALLAGCTSEGGRGSAGFDITENQIISRVLETQECLSRNALTFCPADRRDGSTPTPTAPPPTAMVSPTVTPTAIPSPRVDTALTGGASIACTRAHNAAPCTLLFSFAAFGFPLDATFHVASRLRAPDSDWVVSAAPALDAAAQPPMLSARVALAIPADAEEPRVQFAVLVFLTPPDALPGQFAELADSGTDFAFVTPELALEVITTGPPPSPTATATVTTPVTTPDETPSETPSAPTPTESTPAPPTPTPTETGPLVGPEITYFGVARADSRSLAPSDIDPQGRPIFVRPFGHSLSLIVEGRPGSSGRPVAPSAYAPDGGLPDLHVIVSRPLGNGSSEICDRMPPLIGGVPATTPFGFSGNAAVVDAINDLGCRTDNGAGSPVARPVSAACTQDSTGEYKFVAATTTSQFCVPIAVPWGFPSGDTIVAARLRDTSGNLGAAREIVVRNAGAAVPTPTTVATATRTGPPLFSPTPTIDASIATPTLTVTGSITSTPTPTSTPRPGDPPVITHFGLARADDRPLMPIGFDGEGRPIYVRPVPQGMVLIIEARPGARPLGSSAYRPESVPDLEVIVSRPLGDGSAVVCDVDPPFIGGVPATDPLQFRNDPAVVRAVNDLGCRVSDGTGQPQARRAQSEACTVASGTSTGFGFVASDSKTQYCLPIAAAWAFQDGDTIVAARVHDIDGGASGAREIVVRVED
jgi:hypothetical protein